VPSESEAVTLTAMLPAGTLAPLVGAVKLTLGDWLLHVVEPAPPAILRAGTLRHIPSLKRTFRGEAPGL
jgi:hypothetical protein